MYFSVVFLSKSLALIGLVSDCGVSEDFCAHVGLGRDIHGYAFRKMIAWDLTVKCQLPFVTSLAWPEQIYACIEEGSSKSACEELEEPYQCTFVNPTGVARHPESWYEANCPDQVRTKENLQFQFFVEPPCHFGNQDRPVFVIMQDMSDKRWMPISRPCSSICCPFLWGLIALSKDGNFCSGLCPSIGGRDCSTLRIPIWLCIECGRTFLRYLLLWQLQWDKLQRWPKLRIKSLCNSELNMLFRDLSRVVACSRKTGQCRKFLLTLFQYLEACVYRPLCLRACPLYSRLGQYISFGTVLPEQRFSMQLQRLPRQGQIGVLRAALWTSTLNMAVSKPLFD